MNGAAYLGAGEGSQWQSGFLLQQLSIPSSATARETPFPPLPLISSSALMLLHVAIR